MGEMLRGLFWGDRTAANSDPMEGSRRMHEGKAGSRSRGRLSLALIVALATSVTLFAAPARAVDPAADVKIGKTGPTDVLAGNPIGYTLTVKNEGPDEATNVVVTDALDDSLDDANALFCSVAGAGPCTPSDPYGGSVAPFTLLNGATQTIVIEATVLPDTPDGTTIGNTASVSADESDPDLSNNHTSASPVSTTVGTEADLSIDKTDDPDPVIAGDVLTYTLSVANAGPSDAQDVVVTDSLPAEVTDPESCVVDLPIDCTNDDDFSPYTSDDTSLGTVTSDGAVLVIRGTVPHGILEGATISNDASVASSTSDPDTPNNSTQMTSVIAKADLGVTVEGPASDPIAGDASGFDYEITVTNDGPSDNQGFTVTDTLPEGFSFDNSPDGCVAAAEGFACDHTGAFAPGGDPAVFTAHVLVDHSVLQDTYTNSVEITATSTTDPNETNDSDDVETNVLARADLSFTQSTAVGSDVTDPPSCTVPTATGDLIFANTAVCENTVTFTVEIHNAGPSDAQDVTAAIDTIDPAAGEPLTDFDGCSVTADRCVTPAVLIEAGGDHTFVITAHAKDTLRGGETNNFTKTAYVSSDTEDIDEEVSYPKMSSTDPIRVHTVPDAPPADKFAVLDGNGNIIVRWSAPADGGEPIDKYTITCTPACGPGTTIDVPVAAGSPPACPNEASAYCLSVTLANGSYTIDLQAHNEVGFSDEVTSAAHPSADAAATITGGTSGQLSTGLVATPTNPVIAVYKFPTGNGGIFTVFDNSTDQPTDQCGGTACVGPGALNTLPAGYNNPSDPIRIIVTWDASIVGTDGAHTQIYFDPDGPAGPMAAIPMNGRPCGQGGTANRNDPCLQSENILGKKSTPGSSGDLQIRISLTSRFVETDPGTYKR